jgi:hypothetical protein
MKEKARALSDQKTDRQPNRRHQSRNRGTIAFEVENLGRQLIAVQWSDGPMMYVFPKEIEIGDRDVLPSVH